MVLTHAIRSLSDKAKLQINYDALLPAIIKSIYFSHEGFQSGYFLAAIDHDMVLTDWKLTWPSKSNSFLELQERTARPLFVSMSNLANLAGSAIKATHDVRSVHALLDSIQQFSHSVASQWKTNRLSSVPMPEEVRLVDEQSLKVTIPVVWQILKLVLFTTIIILQGLITRITQYPTFYRRDSKHILSSEVISS